MSTSVWRQDWFAASGECSVDASPRRPRRIETNGDDLVTWLPLPLNRVGRAADGSGVASSIWEDLEYAGEADALAITLRGLSRLEDEVLSV